MKVVSCLLIFFLVTGTIAAQDFDTVFRPGNRLSFSADRIQTEKDNTFRNRSFSFHHQIDSGNSQKSPITAVILSGIIPGLGQWYAGDKIKALGFATTEAALWFGRSRFIDKGDEIKQEFRTYADQFWSDSDYFNWAGTVDISKYSHVLPDTKTQQYYEMIGKYNQFVAGWPDSEGNPDQSEMRLRYMAQHHESNKNYKNADKLVQILVLNRVISAFDAAFSIHRNNKQLRAKFRVKKMYAKSELMPVVNLNYTW